MTPDLSAMTFTGDIDTWLEVVSLADITSRPTDVEASVDDSDHLVVIFSFSALDKETVQRVVNHAGFEAITTEVETFGRVYPVPYLRAWFSFDDSKTVAGLRYLAIAEAEASR